MSAPSKSTPRKSSKKVTIKPKKKGQKPITFKDNGSLRRAAGVDSKTGKLNVGKVRKLAQGSGDVATKARFYLNVLKH